MHIIDKVVKDAVIMHEMRILEFKETITNTIISLINRNTEQNLVSPNKIPKHPKLYEHP